jgi:hypothetical protein
MAYNKENYYKRIIEIQELTIKHRKQGLFFKEIYHKYIEVQYKISKRTYDSYLGINAKKLLKDLKKTNEK